MAKCKVRYDRSGEPSKWVGLKDGETLLVDSEAEALVFDSERAVNKWMANPRGFSLRPGEGILKVIPQS